MTNKLEILDGMCGTGKTTGIFKWMITQPDKRFLYVTPFLEEVTRASNSMTDIEFSTPESDNDIGKNEHLLELMRQGNNIAFTHELFKNMDKNHLMELSNKGYILIIDEECDMIEPFAEGYTKNDIDYMISNNSIKIDYDKLGKITWIDDRFDGQNFKYAKFRNMCNLEMLYSSKSSNKTVCMTVHLPIGLITAAERVILIGYRFEHSIMNHFVKMKGLEVVPFTEVELQPFDKQKLKNLIEILDFRIPTLLSDTGVLSHTWYENNTQKEFDIVSNIIKNICVTNKVTKKDVMWTAPSKYCINVKRSSKKIYPRSFGAESSANKEDGCWVACSSKATNKYAHKSVLIHAFNRFPNQTLLIYLRDYGFVINSNEFALSEAIQWVWRSRIRNSESIKLCFIPKRMRKLFTEWLNDD